VVGRAVLPVHSDILPNITVSLAAKQC